MSPVRMMKSLWRQRRSWSADTADCPDGVPLHQAHGCEDCSSDPLVALSPGQAATVACLDGEPRSLAKLAALGILPGARVHLLQRYPAFVFRVGYGEVAVDEALARLVRVRRA